MHKFISLVLLFFSIVGFILLLNANPLSKGGNTAVYSLLYVFTPLVLAWFVWRQPSKINLIPTLLFYLLFCFPSVSLTSWLPHHSPLSLSVVLEPLKGGQVWLVDLFAISMCILVLLTIKRTNQTSLAN